MYMSSAIAALKAGDEIVFKEIFDEYHHKIYFYILSKTHSTYLAEETTQLTFIKLWQYKNSLDETISISCQIFRIAKTTCFDLLRKEATKANAWQHAEKKEMGTNNISKTLDSKELQQKLNTLVNRMPPARKKVFELSRYNGFSHKEIAQMLSLSTKTVENHIALALKYLKQFLLLLPVCIFFKLF